MKKIIKKIIETIMEITYVVFMIILWIANNYRWNISHYQMLALCIVIAISWTCIIWLRNIKKTYKYIFTTFTFISVIIVVFFGKLP